MFASKCAVGEQRASRLRGGIRQMARKQAPGRVPLGVAGAEYHLSTGAGAPDSLQE